MYQGRNSLRVSPRTISHRYLRQSIQIGISYPPVLQNTHDLSSNRRWTDGFPAFVPASISSVVNQGHQNGRELCWRQWRRVPTGYRYTPLALRNGKGSCLVQTVGHSGYLKLGCIGILNHWRVSVEPKLV